MFIQTSYFSAVASTPILEGLTYNYYVFNVISITITKILPFRALHFFCPADQRGIT